MQRVAPVMLVIAATLLAPLTLRLNAQAAPPFTDLKPAAELRGDFVHIASVVELADGSVLLVDSGDERVVRADFTSHVSTQVGRKGAGPREYERARRLVRGRGDTLLLYARGRYLYYVPRDGLLAKVITEPSMLTMAPTYSDRAGRLYYHGPLMSYTQRRAYDSIPVFRIDPRTLDSDTVAWLRAGTRDKMAAPQEMGDLTRLSISRNPYRYLDHYGVFDDGTILVVRAADYSVDVRSPDGRWTRTAPKPFPKIPVPKSERDARPDWPAIKPPVVYSSSYPELVSPRGQLWVHRHTARDTDAAEYDLLHRTGRLCGRVRLPLRTTVVGFSASWVYAVRKDDDDLEHLQRFPHPTCS